MNNGLIIVRLIFSSLICLIALLLPYRLRLMWFQMISFLVHLPFKLFGALAKWMLKELGVQNPYE